MRMPAPFDRIFSGRDLDLLTSFCRELRSHPQQIQFNSRKRYQWQIGPKA